VVAKKREEETVVTNQRSDAPDVDESVRIRSKATKKEQSDGGRPAKKGTGETREVRFHLGIFKWERQETFGQK